MNAVPNFEYSAADCWGDFWDNPGGVMEVGGSAEVDEYPNVTPRGRFPIPNFDSQGKVAIVGHLKKVIRRVISKSVIVTVECVNKACIKDYVCYEGIWMLEHLFIRFHHIRQGAGLQGRICPIGIMEGRFTMVRQWCTRL